MNFVVPHSLENLVHDFKYFQVIINMSEVSNELHGVDH